MLCTSVLQQAHDYGTECGLLPIKLVKSLLLYCATTQNPEKITLKNVFGSAQVHQLTRAHQPVPYDFAAF